MTRHTNVHVCIADPSTGLAVRKLLAANPKVRVTPWRAEHLARSPLVRDIGSDVRDGEPIADIDVLLVGSDDMSRIEEAEPGRIDELQRRVKVLLLLKSDEVPEALELIRRCDGMIVDDVNLAHISDVIDFARHGYFVIPRTLMASFMLASAPTRAAIVEKIGSGPNGASAIRIAADSRDTSEPEFVATRTTMRNAIRNVLKRSKNGVHAKLEVAPTGRGGDQANPAPAKGSAARLASWRRALRDNDGRVATGEYVLMLAALAVWGAIILEPVASKKSAKMFGWCTSIASSVKCGGFASAPMDRSAANLEVTAKGLDLDRAGDPSKRPDP